MAVGDAYVFPGFLTPVLTLLFFPKPPTTFLTCFCRGERRTYAGKKSRLNPGSNSQPPGYESDTLTTEPPGRGTNEKRSDHNFIYLSDRQHKNIPVKIVNPLVNTFSTEISLMFYCLFQIFRPSRKPFRDVTFIDPQ